MDSTTTKLAQLRVFRQIPTKELETLVRCARRIRLSRQDYLVRQGEIWPSVIFLVTGELRWTMLSVGGREHVLFTVGAGEVFWGHSFFDDEPMPASLIAAGDVEAHVWSRSLLLPVLLRHPRSLWEVTRMQVETMRRAREVIYGLAFHPVATRLASLLLDSSRDQKNTAIERDLTLNEIAAMVASSPEVVCRLLQQFHAEGILEVTRAQITIHDVAALKNMVDAA
ncbi:MAG: Crp/Fnr family transcriptional regulator [Anaerolineae bacterium]|nr:Crp/Fnr family transcriptional regulator [Anaerolineae bacterium]